MDPHQHHAARRRVRRGATLAALALAATGLAACGDDDETTTPTAATGSTAADTSSAATEPSATEPVTTEPVTGPLIVISGMAFQVPDEVPAGTVITVRNDDGVPHTVTADDGSFSVEVPAGGTATFTSPSAGSYAFHCNFHPTMTAELQVA